MTQEAPITANTILADQIRQIVDESKFSSPTVVFESEDELPFGKLPIPDLTEFSAINETMAYAYAQLNDFHKYVDQSERELLKNFNTWKLNKKKRILDDSLENMSTNSVHVISKLINKVGKENMRLLVSYVERFGVDNVVNLLKLGYISLELEQATTGIKTESVHGVLVDGVEQADSATAFNQIANVLQPLMGTNFDMFNETWAGIAISALSQPLDSLLQTKSVDESIKRYKEILSNVLSNKIVFMNSVSR